MPNKRGMSPIIGTILILGFTVALSAVVMTWGSTFIRSTQESTEATVGREISCSTDTRIDIKDAEVKGDTLKLRVENAGIKDIDKISVRIHGSDGTQNVGTSSGLESLEIQIFELGFNSSKVGTVSKVEAFPTIKYKDEEAICSNSLDEKTVTVVSISEWLALYLPFDGDALDDSGNGNHGTLVGGTYYGEGYSGSGAVFDGSGDYINLGNDISLKMALNNFTVEAWVRFNSPNEEQTVFSTKKGWVVNGYRMLMDDGKPAIDSPGMYQSLNTPLNDGNWHYVAWAVAHDSSTIFKTVFYTDGEYTVGFSGAMGCGEGCMDLTNSEMNKVGVDQSDLGDFLDFFNGTIDELRIWNRELSQSEMDTRYAGGELL